MPNPLLAAHKLHIEPALAQKQPVRKQVVQAHMKDAWVKSSPYDKNQYLSFLTNAWSTSRNAEQDVQLSLELLPHLDWTTMHDKVTPWWMYLFLDSNAPLNPTTRSPAAFCGWWNARKHQVSQLSDQWDTALSTDETLFQASPLQEKNQSPGHWRTKHIVQSLRAWVFHSAQSSSTPLQHAVVEFASALAQQQEQKGVPGRFNQVKGQAMEAAFYVPLLTPQWAVIKSQFEQDEVLFLTQSSFLPNNRNRSFVLAGRPEVLVKHRCFQLTKPHSPTFSQDQHEFESQFWSACQTRWEDRQNDPKHMNDHASFFLSSIKVWLPEKIHIHNSDDAQAWKAFVDRVMLCADSGLWPWLDHPQTKATRRM